MILNKDIQPGKTWGISKWGGGSNLYNDEDTELRDQMMGRLSNEQFWVKSDVERLLIVTNAITNDRVRALKITYELLKIECERLTRELVAANKKLFKKRIKIKEQRLEIEKYQKWQMNLVKELD